MLLLFFYPATIKKFCQHRFNTTCEKSGVTSGADRRNFSCYTKFVTKETGRIHFATPVEMTTNSILAPMGVVPERKRSMGKKAYKVVIVRPEEYPETAVLEDLADWFDGGKYVMIPAYTQETIILAPEQQEGLVLNRGLFDAGETQMRQIVAGDFLICGVSEDGTFRSLNDQEIYLYLERFRQPEKFLMAGNVVFCVPFVNRMSYASDLSKKHIGAVSKSDI